MHPETGSLEPWGVAWRLGATLLFVVLNGFFVGAEFALVKVRTGRIQELVRGGHRSARTVEHILKRLDLYLSACQLGITLASLALGALGEPAVSKLILALAGWAGLSVAEEAAWLPIVSLILAFTLITVLHMTVGEQAPKMYALRRPEPTALGSAPVLRAFAFVFRPLIAMINAISNSMLRVVGLRAADHGTEAVLTVEEIRSVLSLSASAGAISSKELEITQNVLRLVELEVRHIMVPRVDVEYVSLTNDAAHNLQVLRDSSHSRFPLCERDLDTIVGFIHGKDVLEKLIAGDEIDLQPLARKPLLVPDTMALSDLLLEMQTQRTHLAAVIDEHGTVIGLAFREDALEEIVGPLGDEFDEETPEFRPLEEGSWEVKGSMAFPDLCARLDLQADDQGEETVGGYLVARLGRMPRQGDTVTLDRYTLTATQLGRRRISRIRVEEQESEATPEDPTTEAS